MIRRTNLQDRLVKQRSKRKESVDDVIAGILADVSLKDALILEEITNGHHSYSNALDIDKLDSDKIYHIATIQ